MKRVQLALFLAALVSAAACTDQAIVQPPATGSPNALIMDGAHSGNPFVFFLPPLVPNPNHLFHAGKFNATLSPVVEVCELTGDPRALESADCKDDTRVFGPTKMSSDPSSEHYQLNWDTKASPLSSTKFYRILVRGAAKGTVLGFLDVDPVDQGMKNVRTGDVVAFQDGRTLPIKVRIEDGAFGSTNSDDHVEQVVPTDIPTGTLDVTTTTGTAGARFSDGWLPAKAVEAGIDQVVVIIERIDVDNSSDETSCLRSGLEELEGCYRFRTDPDLNAFGPFSESVIAGVCFEIPGDIGNPDGPQVQLHRRAEVEGEPTGPAFALEDVPAPFLNCGGFGAGEIGMGEALRSGRLGDIASAGWNALVRGVGRLVMPSTLHAIDFGAGGSTDFFSRFGWARVAHLDLTSAIPATAAAGTDVVINAVVETRHHEHLERVAGEPVTFRVTGGAGTVGGLGVTTVNTNSDGVASVRWRVGTVPATNTLTVTARVYESPMTVTTLGVSDVIDLEALPDGTPACETCLVTNQFASRGIVFSNNLVQLFHSNVYDPTTEPNNHSVTPTTSGTTRLTFAGAPKAVTYRVRLNNGLPPTPLRAFTPSGAAIPAGQISVTTLATYVNGGGNDFRTEAVSITSADGVGSMEFENTDPTAFFYIMDDFVLDYSSPVAACSLEPTPRSIEGAVATSIQFVNATDVPATVYWLDYEAERILYSTLESGQSLVQETYLTHPWVVTNASGACLGVWMPTTAPRLVVIGG